MKMVGLTLGKFVPLHKGHQYLIETAIKETDHVIVVVYDAPEVTPIPLRVRADWVRQLYPMVEVIEGVGAPSAMGDTPEIKKIQEDYLLGLLNGRKVTHFYSSEFYGDHVSKALGAINRQVDTERVTIPISGTAVRDNIYLNRQFVSSIVYKDLVNKIVLLGAESTGKTTLCGKLAEEFNTIWMPEYGKEYWEKYQINKRLTLEQLVELAEGHIEREDEMIIHANQNLFIDTNAIFTYLFSLYYHGKALDRLADLARLTKERYDLVLLCDTDIPYEDTHDRSGAEFRMDFQKKIIDYLNNRNIPYLLISGNVTERVEKVKGLLSTFQKYPVLKMENINSITF